ncbi:globin family protein [Shewanella sedimentimangrovi]|uniref:Hemin receptor n=1 Tax=Shewanella sedimentimangrovi TaxID=2814293 RepID=A0ABX7R1T4_9GAMM|nr:globin family protein [Shewanella sedimentimangrovi]QSX37136.1 hemin receptor [Shewanella sedimentimangrovi]
MSVTAQQVRLIKHSFALVKPEADAAAALFYRTLFEIDPKLKLLFRQDLRSQGRKLMAMLDAAVQGLEAPDKLVPILQDLARRHVKYGVKTNHFSPVGNALLFTLKQGLGDAYTDEVKAAWIAVIHLVADVMKAEMDKEVTPA